MQERAETHFNRIEKPKTFDVAAFVSAYYFASRPAFAPRWEQYDFSQLFFVISGSGVIQTETASYPIRPGMLVYRPAGGRSIYEWTSEHVQYALVSFVCESETMRLLEGAPFTLYEEESAAFLDVVRTGAQICENIHGDPYLRGMRLKSGVPEAALSFIYASLERFLCMIYCRRAEIRLLPDESQKMSRYAQDTQFVASVRTYLEEHVEERLSMADICTHFWVSQTALSRKFRADTGVSVMDYLTELKIEEAKRRIRRSALSFTEIAAGLGFSSLNYFTKVFKNKTGYTPTEYSRYISKRREGIRVLRGDSN